MTGDRHDQHFHGLVIPMHAFAGAKAVRIVHPGGQSIGEHRHDWPCLTLHALGEFQESFDGGEARIAGPAALLHPAGAAHADEIGATGLETVSIAFDPRWLGRNQGDIRVARSRCWRGGRVAAAALRLAADWARKDLGETAAATATANFLRFALAQEDAPGPQWLEPLVRRLEEDGAAETRTLARTLSLHPAWLAHAYRRAVGEGLAQTRRRKRVECAVRLLRHSKLAAAEVALSAGFCDQSHMNRCVRAVTGRTPLQIRAERVLLAGFAPGV